MKKRLLSFVIALCCFILPLLTSCGSGEKYVPKAKVKPITVTLYGIKGEGTTDEAVKAVQDELNLYTESNLNTRVLLRLFTEDEYYEKLDEAFKEAEEYQANKKNNKNDSNSSDTSEEEDAEYEIKFEDEKGTQVDIFMVRGMEKYQEYVNRKLAASIKIEEKSSLISKYVSARYIALTSVGTPAENGTLSKSTIYGIPCNYVDTDYTYLLVNKEIATQYHYAATDVSTLDGLANFLDDAATNHSDYITLYNEPELNISTIGNTLIGGMVTDKASAYFQLDPENLFSNSEFVNFNKNLNLFRANSYITEGDAYALPEGEKVAAAFIKGNAATAKEYEDEYFVIPYAKPYMEDIGTVYCVGKYAANTSRCVEVINALMSNKEYRNTFQYGVENVHYRINSYTREYEIISSDYNMNYADTGNMFLLEPNAKMSEHMLELSANDWELAKTQYRDTVFSPYIKFGLEYITEDNYKDGEWYDMIYDQRLEEALVSAKSEAEAKGEELDEKAFKNNFKENFSAEYEVGYTSDLLEKVSELSSQAYEALMAYDPGSAEITFEEHAAVIADNFISNDEVINFISSDRNPDSPVAQYLAWVAKTSR